MRPYVADDAAFSALTSLHSEGVIREHASIYALLEQNARIHREFLFLMKLSAQIPPLQTHAQFVYIRDFIMGYERKMKQKFSGYNQSARRWNLCVRIKNMTVIGLLFPWQYRDLL